MPLCDCPDCQSVISPAAYLVDLLAFLLGCNAAALDELMARRPEIQSLQLTCDNTLTPLPYIDLVNEVLELAAVQPTPPPPPYQTTWSADELAANPEHVLPAAYDLLRNAVFPWSLPFDLWTEEARVYLAHFGIDRVELMQRLQSAVGPTDENIAQEFLRVTDTEWDLIATQAATAAQQQTYWGTTNLADVAKVSLFLQVTGLSAAQLPDSSTATSSIRKTATTSVRSR